MQEIQQKTICQGIRRIIGAGKRPLQTLLDRGKHDRSDRCTDLTKKPLFSQYPLISALSLLLPHRNKVRQQHHHSDNHHELQEKIQESFAALIVEPEIYRHGIVPPDECCIIRKARYISPRADTGKQGVLHIEFLREGNIDMIGALEGCLKVVITNG